MIYLVKLKPYLGLQSKRPYWWPNNILYVSPKNNRSVGHPMTNALKQIIRAFMASTTAEEVDETQDILEKSQCDGENGELGTFYHNIHSVSICF